MKTKSIKKRFLRQTGYYILVVCLCLSIQGCGKKKTPPPPSVHPALVLELYEAAHKEQDALALQKLRKLKALEPSNVFLGELEHIFLFNQLAVKINECIFHGDYESALKKIAQYEKIHGRHPQITQTKVQLQLLSRIDHSMDSICHARNLEQAEIALADLKKMSNWEKFSPSLLNFVKNKESIFRQMRNSERQHIAELLYIMAEQQYIAGRSAQASAIAAVLMTASPDFSGAEKLLSAEIKSHK